jgi:simple sugar transport system ATP-binding protein
MSTNGEPHDPTSEIVPGEHALLELRNICKYFGNVTALENITTRVEAGKVTCVLGDNGAGKSTFIKILSGVHQPSSGEYTMYGSPVHFTTPRDARNAGIPRCRTDARGCVHAQRVHEEDGQGRDGQDGHRPSRCRSTGRHALGW